jgi:hypothetical protein
MKILLILLIFASCVTGREEIQVRGSYIIILDITRKERFGEPEQLILHLQSDNGIRYSMEAPLQDSNYYIVGRRYPFLTPR